MTNRTRNEIRALIQAVRVYGNSSRMVNGCLISVNWMEHHFIISATSLDFQKPDRLIRSGAGDTALLKAIAEVVRKRRAELALSAVGELT